MADYTTIKQQAQTVRNETKAAANTASRVGGVLEGIVDALIEREKYMKQDGDATIINSTSRPEGRFSEVRVTHQQIYLLHYPEVQADGFTSKGIGIVISDGDIKFYSEIDGYNTPLIIHKDGRIQIKGLGNDLVQYMYDMATRIARIESVLGIASQEEL